MILQNHLYMLVCENVYRKVELLIYDNGLRLQSAKITEIFCFNVIKTLSIIYSNKWLFKLK